MADELTNETMTNQDSNQMYLDEIKELKNNSVSKQQYDKLLEENRNLLKSLVEGSTQEAPAEEKPSRDIKDILTDFNGDSTNLDHIKAVLELHDKNLEKGINDFVPQGYQIAPTDEDIEDAKKVEDFLRDLVKVADGNPAVFNNEYQRRVIDIAIPRRK